MFSSHYVVLFALAINLRHVKGLLVESIDGSFVPWSFVARAPGDAIAVRLTNNHDLAYLVSSNRYTSILSADQAVGSCQDGLVLVFRFVSPLFPTHS